MDDVGQGSDKPRRRRRRSSQGGAAGDDEAAAPAAGAEQVTAPRRARKASKRREAGAAGGATAEPAEAKPARLRARRRAQSAASAGDGGLQGAEGQDGAEDFTGLLLSDLVDGAAAPAARPPRRAAAGGRRARGGAEAAEPPTLDLEPPASSDEEGEAAAGGRRLLEAVGRLDAAGAQQGGRAAARRGPEVRPESEFHAGAAGEEVTMEDLLAPLAEGAAFGEVRRQLEGLARTEAVAEPAAEPKRQRGDRSAEYGRSAQDAAKWRGQIERMRTAEQVELGEAPKLGASMSGLAQHAEPRDDFERELEEITRAAGAAEEDLQSAKALPVNGRQRDEQQRQQVAKLKALLFREQQASKRVKKIKSKAYHRIQRRAEAREREALLERLDSENPELAKTLRQEYEKKHAEKRMLRQRNARRKWAQTMQRFAKGDKTAQREVSKRAQDAHDEERGLKRAIKGQDPDRSDDSDAVDLSASDSEAAAPGRRSVAKQTLERAKKLTAGELRDLEEGGELPTTGLLGMNFMRNAIQQRREEAKLEAKGVLKELQGLDERLDAADGDSDDEEEKEGGGGAEGQAGGPEKQGGGAEPKQFTAEELAAARQQVDKIFEEEDGGFDCSVSGPLTVRGVSSTAPPRAPPAAASTPEAAPKPAKPTQPAKPATSAKPGKPAAPPPENPWLRVGLGGAGAGAAPAAGSGADGGPAPAAASEESAGASGGAGRGGAAAEKKGRKKRKRAAAGEEAGGEEAEGAALAGDVLSVLNADTEAAQEQRDLVRTAFVEGTQEEDFEEEQNELERKREESERGPEELAGWGHWTGEGAPARKLRRQKAEPKAPEAGGAKKSHVQIYEGGPGDKAAKYFVDRLPHGMTSAQQYGAQMKMPLGPEWTGLQTHLQRVKPKTFVKVGNIVPPLQFVKHLPPQQRDTALKTWSAARQPKRLKARI